MADSHTEVAGDDPAARDLAQEPPLVRLKFEDAGRPEQRVEAADVGAIAAKRDVIGSPTHVGDVYQAIPLPRAEEVGPTPAGAADASRA